MKKSDEMFRLLTDAKKKNIYSNTLAVYDLIPEEKRFLLYKIADKEIMRLIFFERRVIDPIVGFCEKFFDNEEHGFSYFIGTYLGSRDYQNSGNIEHDLKMFESLTKVYNFEKFPTEFDLLQKLISVIKESLDICKNIDEQGAYAEG